MNADPCGSGSGSTALSESKKTTTFFSILIMIACRKSRLAENQNLLPAGQTGEQQHHAAGYTKEQEDGHQGYQGPGPGAGPTTGQVGGCVLCICEIGFSLKPGHLNPPKKTASAARGFVTYKFYFFVMIVIKIKFKTIHETLLRKSTFFSLFLPRFSRQTDFSKWLS